MRGGVREAEQDRAVRGLAILLLVQVIISGRLTCTADAHLMTRSISEAEDVVGLHSGGVRRGREACR